MTMPLPLSEGVMIILFWDKSLNTVVCLLGKVRSLVLTFVVTVTSSCRNSYMKFKSLSK